MRMKYSTCIFTLVTDPYDEEENMDHPQLAMMVPKSAPSERKTTCRRRDQCFHTSSCAAAACGYLWRLVLQQKVQEVVQVLVAASTTQKPTLALAQSECHPSHLYSCTSYVAFWHGKAGLKRKDENIARIRAGYTVPDPRPPRGK
jgi:hypothetical protein